MSFLDWVEPRLQLPLPGWRAQAKFQPELSYGRHFQPPPVTARRAAVLLLLYPVEDRWTIPLTLRPVEMLDHAGQVSLPGGTIEPNETSEAAARRELIEELGATPTNLRMLGPLSPIYLFNSNFYVEPWLAATTVRPEWSPNLAEVAELIEAPMDELCDPRNHIEWSMERFGIQSRVPGVQFATHRIWGGTCMMLAELMALLEEYRLQRF